MQQIVRAACRRRSVVACGAALAFQHCAVAIGASPDSAAASAADTPSAGQTATLGTSVVTAPAPQRGSMAADTPGVVQRVTQDQIDAINVTTTEDVVKYQPNLMVRKRFIGDRNSVFAGRDFNELQSARGLVYADGLLLSNLLGSSYSYPPRWSIVAPEDIAGVDILYGPFSALYPGNSIGTTISLLTREPDKLEASVQTQVMSQHFADPYGGSGTFNGNHESVRLADRVGRFWYSLNLDRLENHGQPLQYAVAGKPVNAAGVPVTGAATDLDPSGLPRTILGPTSIDTTRQLQQSLRMGYHFTDQLEGTLTVAHWENRYSDRAETFLRDAAGNPVYAGNVSIGGQTYTIAPSTFAPDTGQQENWLTALGLKARLGGWRIDTVASYYDVTQDVLRSASTAPPAANTGGPGTVFYGDGTGWRTFDIKAESPSYAGHKFTVGYHYDNYLLRNETFNASNWQAETLTGINSVYRGNTETQAVFGQDAWRFAPGWLATLGLRYEYWRAYGGALGNAAGTLDYAARSAAALSPKASVAWQATDDWLLKLSFGAGTRFPTVAELFQGTISNNAIVNNNPNLQPERAIDWDFTAERALSFGTLRFSLFQSDIRNTIYTQTDITVTPTVTNIQNIGRVRTRGVEVAFSGQNVLLHGLGIDANLALTTSKILADAQNPAVVGNNWVRMPRVRANLLASYRFATDWLASVGVRYSGRQYSALDNSDINPGSYGGTSSFLVVDLKAVWRITPHVNLSLGVDNLTDRRYYVYHPYPGRTIYGALQWHL